MDSVFSFAVGLLTAALSLLGYVQKHPELPQASRDQAQQVAQQAITQATQALANAQNTTSNQAASDVCTLVVDGQNYPISPCEVKDHGAYGKDFTGKKFFVTGLNTTDANSGWWNGPSGASRAHDPLPGGKLTRIGDCYQNDRVKLCESRSHTTQKTIVSVSGMSKYTDTDFGFSFWYPSGWIVTSTPSNAGTADMAGNLLKGRITVSGAGVVINIDKIHSDERTYNVNPGACGYCGPVKYYFDANLHTWMKHYPDGPGAAPDATQEQIAQYKIPKPADISQNTMGGLHVFSTEQKESAVIVPLSARNFLFVKDETYTQQCGGYCASPDVKGGATYLANTVVATDPSVAVPVSIAEQIKVVEAEKSAYTTQ